LLTTTTASGLVRMAQLACHLWELLLGLLSGLPTNYLLGHRVGRILLFLRRHQRDVTSKLRSLA